MTKKIFKIYLIYFISMATFCLVRIASAYGVLNFLHTQIADIIYSCLIQIGVLFLLPLLLYKLMFREKEKNKIKTIYKKEESVNLYKPVGLKVVLIALGLGILGFFINIAASTLFSGLLAFLGYEKPTISLVPTENPIFPTWLSFLIEVFTTAMLPAFCEEFLHRNLLLKNIKEIGIKKAIVISSLLFGLLHFNINQFFYAFVIGLLLALVTVVSKSIYPAMIIHFMNNFLSVYLTYAESENWIGGNFYKILNYFLQSNSPILTFLACFAFLSIVVLLLILLVNKLFRIQTLDKVQNVIDSMYTSDERATTNSPIVVEKSKILQEMLENNTTLNLDYEEMKNPLDIVLPKYKNIYKPDLKDNMFLISSCVLGGLVTIFTFIWGLF